MKSTSLLSVSDLSFSDIEQVIKRAMQSKAGISAPVLAGKALALLFEKPSLRTKVSFDLAIHRLGGHSLYLSPEEVGLGKREPVADVARVLGRYVDGIIARTFSHKTLELLDRHASVPVINALSDQEHPCQALGDLLTIYEKKGRLHDLTLAFIGDGNNVANSLLLAASLTGLNFSIASPLGYHIRDDLVQTARDFARQSGAQIWLSHDPRQSVKDADIVYTDVWTSMGQEAEAVQRRAAFAGYQVDTELLKLARKDAILMHPMPAHYGEEIAPGLENHPASVMFDQAENRFHIQKALLTEIFLQVPEARQAAATESR